MISISPGVGVIVKHEAANNKAICQMAKKQNIPKNYLITTLHELQQGNYEASLGGYLAIYTKNVSGFQVKGKAVKS